MSDFSDLNALFVNCTLKRSPEPSNTGALMANAVAIMRAQGVRVEEQRAVDLEIPPGVQADMTKHGADRDDSPGLMEHVLAADIFGSAPRSGSARARRSSPGSSSAYTASRASSTTTVSGCTTAGSAA